MEKQIKTIETEYKNFRFRSRTEARWAIYFDALGVKWRYEVEGFKLPSGDLYLPDFYFPEHEAYGEVKPDNFKKDIRHNQFVSETGNSLLIFVGPPSEDYNYQLWKEGDNGDVRKIEGRAFADEIMGKYGIMYYGDVLSEDWPALAYALRKANNARFEYGEKNNIKPYKP